MLCLGLRWFIIFTVIFLLPGTLAHATPAIDKTAMVYSIIGEAEGEGYYGMLAVACAIRNKGNLEGVNGLTSRRVLNHEYSSSIFVMAVRAYEESAKIDIVDGATVWGTISDIAKFKKQKWFKKYYLVKIIGNHYFYKRRQ